jgi:hypothetical protein
MMFEDLLKAVSGVAKGVGAGAKKTKSFAKDVASLGGGKSLSAGAGNRQAQGFFQDPSSRTGWSFQSGLGNVASAQRPSPYEKVITRSGRSSAGFAPEQIAANRKIALARAMMAPAASGLASDGSVPMKKNRVVRSGGLPTPPEALARIPSVLGGAYNLLVPDVAQVEDTDIVRGMRGLPPRADQGFSRFEGPANPPNVAKYVLGEAGRTGEDMLGFLPSGMISRIPRVGSPILAEAVKQPLLLEAKTGGGPTAKQYAHAKKASQKRSKRKKPPTSR